MFTPKAHIIIIDGAEGSGRNTLCFELALALLYNAQRTAIVLPPDSPLRKAIINRQKKLPQLLTPVILNRENFYNEANNFSAVIIPHTDSADDFAAAASTYITILPREKSAIQDFIKNNAYLNNMFELKKKIASLYGHSLNWIICENNKQPSIAEAPSKELEKISRLHGFRLTPPLNRRLSYQNNISGISAQDKSLPLFKNELTYEDICAKREIINLAEFIFS